MHFWFLVFIIKWLTCIRYGKIISKITILINTRCLSGLRPSIACLRYGLQWLVFGWKMLLFAKTQILKLTIWYPKFRFGESDDFCMIRGHFVGKGDILSNKGTFVGQGDICQTRGHFLSDKGTFPKTQPVAPAGQWGSILIWKHF